MKPNDVMLRVAVLAMCYLPFLAHADAWDQTATSTAKKIQIGLYAIAGTCAVVTLLYSGLRWMIARSSGDHSHSFTDYLQQCLVIVVVGGSSALAAGLWQIYGTLTN
jgi:hypothetical protein